MTDLAQEAVVITRLRAFARLMRCVGYTMERLGQTREQHLAMVGLIVRAVLDGQAANPDAVWPRIVGQAADMPAQWANGPEWRPMAADDYVEFGEWLDQLLSAYSTVLEGAAA